MKALAALPADLRDPLLEEYNDIATRFQERRWSPAELSAGRFCEVVYTILKGHADGRYASKPSKPRDFVGACRKLEANTHVPRSFQILIPRLLPALYEVRNNRGVGHVGGDVDPNHMDAELAVNSAGWVMAELVRVFHGLTTAEAQRVADRLAESRSPLVWVGVKVRRVLNPGMPLGDQIVLLASTSAFPVSVDELFVWTGYEKRPYYLRVLRQLHKARQIELSSDESLIELLPPGSARVESIARATASSGGAESLV